MAQWNSEQAQFCRGLISHYCSTLGVGVNEMAETTGISRERLNSFANNTLSELSSTELDKFFELAGELARAEKVEVDQYEKRGQQVPYKTYQDVIRQVVGIEENNA
jgi:hypothetical protein